MSATTRCRTTGNSLHPRLAILTTAILAGGGPASSVAASSPSPYLIHDLGTILPEATAAPGSIAHGIGADGRVVGESVLGDLEGRLHGFVWSPAGGMVALAPPPDLPHAVATAITDAGVVYGTAYDLGSGETRAVRWNGAAPEDLGPFEITAAAEDGTLVGGSVDGDPALHRRPVRWSAGILSSLPGLGGRDGLAQAIAADGDIAGTCSLADESRTHAVLWRDGVPIDLGTLGGASSRGRAAASGGRVVGDADRAEGPFHACLFLVAADGSVTRQDLGAMAGASSSARDLNEAGDIVGTSGSRAILWRDRTMTDLNDVIPHDSGWHLAVACAIDDAGRIAGVGVRDGQPRAFRLDPRPRGDVNGDGAVGLGDLLLVLANWGPCAGCPADLDGDGTVGFGDLLVVLEGWGA